MGMIEEMTFPPRLGPPALCLLRKENQSRHLRIFSRSDVEVVDSSRDGSFGSTSPGIAAGNRNK